MIRRGWRLTLAVGIAGAFALIAAGTLAWAWPRLFPTPLQQARAAYERREWSRASFLALGVLRERPADPDALRLLAWSSGRLGRDEIARSVYKRIGFDALGPEDLLAIGSGLQRQGDFGSALRVLEKGHDLDPDHADILDDLGRSCASTGRLNRAEELAERLVGQPGQGARGEVLLGSVRDRLSDPAGAAEAFERALRIDPTLKGLDPGLPEARKILARNYLRLGDFARARDHLRRIGGADPEIAWLMGRSWLQEGRPEQAAAAETRAGGYRNDHPMAPEPSPYVGSSGCADCHQAIHRAQQSSRHARTFLTGADLARLATPVGAVRDPADPKGIDHRARRDGDQIRWETRAGGKSASAVVRYALGSGDRGVTPIGLDEGGRFRELRLSRYGDIDAWDLTAGHSTSPAPSSAEEALGKVLGVDDVRTCLGCHTTDYRASRDQYGPTARETGIGCERCHGPGGNHLKAVAAGSSDLAIARPKLATPEQVTGLCAQCHNPSNRKILPSDPDAVRFQGATLPWSRCYQESRGKLSCVTCHDPHHDASRSAPSYEAKCLACHASRTESPVHEPGSLPTLASGQGAPCPVNPKGDCVRCHMPSTSSAVPHTTFTDHQIRVHPSPGTAR